MTRADRDALIEQHLDIARIIALSVGGRLPWGLDLRDELHAEALLLLVKAADSFDPERGLSFPTWAKWFINRRIIDMLRRNRLKDRQHVQFFMPSGGWMPEGDSCDDDALATDKRLCFEMPATQERDVERRELRERVGALLAGLPEKYRRFYYLRYGRDMTMVEIGEQMDMTPEMASWIHWKLKDQLSGELEELADAA